MYAIQANAIQFDLNRIVQLISMCKHWQIRNFLIDKSIHLLIVGFAAPNGVLCVLCLSMNTSKQNWCEAEFGFTEFNWIDWEFSWRRNWHRIWPWWEMNQTEYCLGSKHDLWLYRRLSQLHSRTNATFNDKTRRCACYQSTCGDKSFFSVLILFRKCDHRAKERKRKRR